MLMLPPFVQSSPCTRCSWNRHSAKLIIPRSTLMVSKHTTMIQNKMQHTPAAWHADFRKSVPLIQPGNKESSKVTMRASIRVSSLATVRPRTTNSDPNTVGGSTTIGVLSPDRINLQTFISPKSFLNPHCRANWSPYPQMTCPIMSQLGMFHHLYNLPSHTNTTLFFIVSVQNGLVNNHMTPLYLLSHPLHPNIHIHNSNHPPI